jgi:hypothetical protein
MDGKDKRDRSKFRAPYYVTAITIGIITTSILFVGTLVLNQNHTAMAQQQQQPNGTSFQMDNMHM